MDCEKSGPTELTSGHEDVILTQDTDSFTPHELMSHTRLPRTVYTLFDLIQAAQAARPGHTRLSMGTDVSRTAILPVSPQDSPHFCSAPGSTVGTGWRSTFPVIEAVVALSVFGRSGRGVIINEV